MNEVKQLIDGYRRFHKKYFQELPAIYNSLFEQGQAPKILVIACCDSRVHPAQILDTEPGDIFVIRNVANLVPAHAVDDRPHGTSAAMEFAVKHLGVKHIIVFGHGQCGGIKSLMEGEHLDPDYSFIDPWMKIAQAARDDVIKRHGEADFAKQCAYGEQAAIKISLHNLLTFPWIKERHGAGTLFIHGWYFDIETGVLLAKQGDQFVHINDTQISN